MNPAAGRLSEVVGAENYRNGSAEDAINGVEPVHVVAPGSVPEVSALLRIAADAGLSVVARGTGSRISWGAAPCSCDLLVDLSRLNQVIDHAAGDMVVDVQAGLPLCELAETVAAHRQQLAIDLPGYDDGAVTGAGSVGGAIATAHDGPSRLHYGALRDMLLGVSMVRADGEVAVSGGRVVKNVAGYDLGKLMAGSFGTLGIIVSATLRLYPLPQSSGWVRLNVSTADAAQRAAQVIMAGQQAPTAIEIDRPHSNGPIELVTRFDGSAEGVHSRARTTAERIGGTVIPTAPDWYGAWPGGADGTLIKISAPPAQLATVLAAIADAAAAAGALVPVRGGAGTGIVHTALPADTDPPAAGTFVTRLRGALAPRLANTVLVHAPPAVLAGTDPWGPVDPAALELMRRVKDRFDPARLLSPGRFVGGI